MNKNNSVRTKGLFNSFRQYATDLTDLSAGIDNLLKETQHDWICGSWVALDSDYALIIRKTEDGYSCAVCDIAKGFKIKLWENSIKKRKDKLCIFDCWDNMTTETVSYNVSTAQLHFGHYGIFEPEERTISQLSYDEDIEY